KGTVGRCEGLIAPAEGRASSAAVNGPAGVVVSGEAGGLDELIAACEREEVWARRIAVDYASYSAQLESIEDELAKVLGPVAPVPGSVPFYSTAVGDFVDTTVLDGGYWY
ncbi:hypothetical protein VM98_36970, partial [Streptomyces rubellomurinus subsp. indigoferus]